jgi:hypothetical protein
MFVWHATSQLVVRAAQFNLYLKCVSDYRQGSCALFTLMNEALFGCCGIDPQDQALPLACDGLVPVAGIPT